MPSRLRFVLGQLGSRRQGAESERDLIDVADLPGSGWAVVDRRTWRTGHQKSSEPWAERAGAAGSVTAWRSFRAQDRWLWAQLVPLADAADNDDALRSVPAGALANLRSRHTVETEGEIGDIHVPRAEGTLAYQQCTTDGSASATSLLLAFTSGSRLCVLGASGRPDWTWQEVVDIAGHQLDRLAGPTG